MSGSCECGKETSGSIKCGVFSKKGFCSTELVGWGVCEWNCFGIVLEKSVGRQKMGCKLLQTSAAK